MLEEMLDLAGRYKNVMANFLTEEKIQTILSQDPEDPFANKTFKQVATQLSVGIFRLKMPEGTDQKGALLTQCADTLEEIFTQAAKDRAKHDDYEVAANEMAQSLSAYCTELAGTTLMLCNGRSVIANSNRAPTARL